MTLLLREVVAFVGGAGLWIVVLAAASGLVAAGILALSGRPLDRRHIGVAVVVAGLTAALAARLDLVVWDVRIGGRPLPIMWAVLGSAGAVATVILRDRGAR